MIFLITVNIKMMSALGKFYDAEKQVLKFKIGNFDDAEANDGLRSISVVCDATKLVIEMEGDFVQRGDGVQSAAFHHLSNIACVMDNMDALVSFLDLITGDYWDEAAGEEDMERLLAKRKFG